MMTIKQCHDKPKLMTAGLPAVRRIHPEETRGSIPPASIRSILPTGLAIPSLVHFQFENDALVGAASWPRSSLSRPGGRSHRRNSSCFKLQLLSGDAANEQFPGRSDHGAAIL